MTLKNDIDDFSEQERTGRYRKPIQRTFTEYEMRDFDDELEKFRVTKEITYPVKDTISFIDEKLYLKSKGALTDKGIRITNLVTKTRTSGNAIHSDIDCDPILYEELQVKLRAWANWKGRKEYGVNFFERHRNKLAEQMTIKNAIDPYKEAEKF